MSTQVSADFIWRVVKGNNAFLKKQRFGRGKEGAKLSTESSNLLSSSSFKYSGIAHKGLGMQLSTNGVVFSRRGLKDATSTTNKSTGAAVRIASKGRKDLKTAARARAQRLKRLATRKTRKTWKA
eukprot:TRINITY_DN1247_c0_g2_i1.p2 TRINITY_DN1247_c0_g2~~TRINITY_DN1247_c0_g2_i1.p2  ORF type:complete len:125 (+),score=34.81 TRINITY_DN1247_c0_g2_i1:74-448(+)